MYRLFRYYLTVPKHEYKSVRILGAKYHPSYDKWICYDNNKHIFRRWHPIHERYCIDGSAFKE